MLDSLAREALASPNALILFLLASPSVALAGFIVYYAWSGKKTQSGSGWNGNGNYEPRLTRVEFYERIEAVRADLHKNVDDKFDDIMAAISALRQENRAYSASLAEVRERVVALETRVRPPNQ